MATSTTTLLELVNEVLLNIGERQVSTVVGNSVTYPALKTISSLKTALFKLEEASDWQFTKQTATASSWSTNAATVPEYTRILGVTHRLTGDVKELTPLSVSEFNLYTPQAGNPIYYLPLDETTVLFWPYPTVTEIQDEVRLELVSSLTFPTTDAGTFPVPEKFTQYLRHYAQGSMIENHLGDPNAAQIPYREAQQILDKLVLRNQSVVTGHRTMWRAGRKYTRGITRVQW